MNEQTVQLRIGGMHCAGCVAKVEQILSSVEGVEDVEVNLAAETARATLRTPALGVDRLIIAAREGGYDAQLVGGPLGSARAPGADAGPYARPGALALVIGSAVAVAGLEYLANRANYYAEIDYHWIRFVQGTLTGLSLASAPGRTILAGGWRAIRRRAPDMDLLVSIGVAAAFLSGLVSLAVPATRAFHFQAAAMIVVFVTLGRHLEARTRREASSAMTTLAQRIPRTALRIENRQTVPVPVEQVQVGDHLRVPEGTVVPIDGRVIEGSAGINEAAVTGESVPVARSQGDLVRAGGLICEGMITIEATATASASAIGRILLAVEQAQAGKTRMQRIADRVAGVFVPVVLGLALLTVVGWLTASGLGWASIPAEVGSIGWAVRCGLAVLVIACPCAMGLATPMAVLVATGAAALRGILVRDAAALEAAGRLDVVLLDKTGTLTTGWPEVRDVFDEPVGPITAGDREVLEWAASAEQLSQHPLAKAIVARAHELGLPLHHPDAFTNDPGLGVVATVRGRPVVVGSAALMAKNGVDLTPVDGRYRQMSADGQTVALLAIDGICAGLIGLTDTPHSGASRAVQRIADAGLEVAMVTGDQAATASALAAEIGIKEVHAEMLPQQKLAEVQRRQQEGQRVAFVGDGINDAPALTAADVGIAFATGTDVAVESADITLLRTDLSLIPEAIDLARRSVRIIKQNLFWAFAYNAAAIPLAATGTIPPGWAAAAMMFSSISVVLNSLRLRTQPKAVPPGSALKKGSGSERMIALGPTKRPRRGA